MSWPATRRGTGGMLPNIICSGPAGYENRVGRPTENTPFLAEAGCRPG